MKFAKDPYWMKSGIYTILNGFSALVFGFGGFLILIRILPKSEFGTWALFITVTAIIEVARNGLIQNAQIKFAAGASKEDYPKVLTASLMLNIIVTMCSIVLLLVFAPVLSNLWHSPAISKMFYLYSITTFLLIGFSQFNFIQQANYDFKGIFVTGLIRQGTFFSVILYFYFTKTTIDLLSLVLFQMAAAFMALCTGFIFVRKYFRVVLPVDWQWVKKLFHFGKFVFGTNISSMIYSSVDQMILGAMMPTSEVAIFNAANRMTNFIDVPVAALSSIVFPKSAQRVAEQGKDAVVYLYERAVGLLLAIIIPIVIVLGVSAKFIMNLAAGTGYANSIPVMQVILAASILQPFMRQFGVVVDSTGRPRINFYLLLGIMFYNIGAIYFFVSLFKNTSPALGAALGGSSAMLLFVIIAGIILRRLYGIKYSHTLVYCLWFYKDGFTIIKEKVFKIKSNKTEDANP